MNEKKPTLLESCLPIIIMLLLLYFGGIKGGMKAQPLLIISSAITLILARRVGLKWSEVQQELQKKVAKAIPSVLIMISAGMIISTWMASGTIPMMIYYGIQIISPQFLIVTAFIVTAIVSICTGTSYGAVGTMGLAAIGIATALDVNLAMVAGAVVSGAYFGDKLSPLSDTTNMAPIYAGSDLYSHIAHMLYTTIPSTVICLVVYTLLGLNGAGGAAQSDVSDTILSTIRSAYNLNILLILPVVIVLAGAILKFSTLPVMGTAAIVAGIETVVFQGISLKNAVNCALNGFSVSMITAPSFDAENVSDAVITLLERGGMTSMMNSVITVFCAFIFGSILTSAGYLDVILEKLLTMVKTTGQLITSTVLAGWVIAMVTGSCYMTMMLNGELFAPVYREKKLAAKNLSRTLEDAGTVIVPLIPWGSAGVYMASTLGVETIAYAPWAILCYSCSIIAIILGFTGIGIAKMEEEAS